MTTRVQNPDRIEMSQRERGVIKVMQPVLRGERTQAEAAALLGITVRQVRRIQRELERQGDLAAVHGLKGKPSNHQPDAKLKRRVLEAYRASYKDFGPTFAAEKLAEVQRLLVDPPLPGLRGGKVVVEERLDGSMKIRFGGKYPAYKEITRATSPGGSAPRPPEFVASAADASGPEEEGPAPDEGGRAGVQPSAGRSGCTPAEPYPPDGEKTDSAKANRRPAENHPWR